MNVTIVMPVYNAAGTIAVAIESILNQTLTDFEFIIIDDCSRDRSLEVITSYAKKDARIKVIANKENQGVMKSLNHGIAQARGKFVARMDADDESVAGRLLEQQEALEADAELALVGANYSLMGRHITKDILVNLPLTNDEIQSTILKYNPICHPVVMFRKDAFEAVGGYREFFKNSEDYDLWLRMSKKYKLKNLSHPSLRYRLSTAGATLAKRWQMYEYHMLAIKSYHSPDEPLDTLFEKVRAELQSEDKSSFLKMFYRDTYQKLRALGFYKEALQIYVRLLTS